MKFVPNPRISDVALAGSAPHIVTRQQVVGFSAGLILSVAFIACLYNAGFGVGTFGSLAILVGSCWLGLYIPVHRLGTVAHQRRGQFSVSFSAFLELVNMMLAGGAGLETALVASSRAGDDWVFLELERVFETARATRQSPWNVLHEFGSRYDLSNALEVAASLQLAGEQGSRVRQSLSAKATTIRMRQLAEAEAEAHSATERMGVPTVLLFVGFIVLLGYPALTSVLGTW